MPRRVTGLSVLLLVLFALQSLLVAVRVDLPMIAALHPLNGFAILGVAIMTTRSSWRLRHASTTTTATAIASPDEAGIIPALARDEAR
jgi:hypothetical protein